MAGPAGNVTPRRGEQLLSFIQNREGYIWIPVPHPVHGTVVIGWSCKLQPELEAVFTLVNGLLQLFGHPFAAFAYYAAQGDIVAVKERIPTPDSY